MSISRPSLVSSAAMLVVRGRWRALEQLAQNSELSSKSKKNAIHKLIVSCLNVAPFAKDNSHKDLDLLAISDSRAACLCASFQATSTIMYKHILQKDLFSANRYAQSAIVTLADIAANTDKSFTGKNVEEMVGHSASMVNLIASQAELVRSIESFDISRRAAFVLGMHRSGTSALTGLLAKAGLSAPLDLMPASPKNPMGYWESMSIFRANERFLDRIGLHWSSSLSLPSGWSGSDAAREWRSELIGLFTKVYKKARCPLVKDPRFCILIKGLEPWLESGMYNPVFFIPIRHPIDVALSLEKAENLPPEQGLRIWIKSVLEAEYVTRGFDRKFVMFSDLISDPSGTLERCIELIQASFSRDGIDHVDNIIPRAPTMHSSFFIDPTLQHQRFDLNESSWTANADMLTARLTEFALSLFGKISTSVDDDVPAGIFDSFRLESLRFLV